MTRDPKNGFYRTLKLDKLGRDALKFFRDIKPKMINELEEEELEEPKDPINVESDNLYNPMDDKAWEDQP